MKIRNLVNVTACSILLLSGNTVFASQPRPLADDARVKKVMYNPNSVVKIHGHYRYATTITFADDEIVQGAILGDSNAWEVSPARNMLFLKPILEQAATNLTVLTNKRSYIFDLNAHGGYVKNPKNATYNLRFTYPDAAQNKLESLFVNVNPNHAVSPDRLNFDYSYAGSPSLKPKRVFDDSEFTYIQFPKNTDYPAIFLVNEAAEESLVNFTIKGEYLVLPTVVARLSLRNGTQTVCLFNEKLYSGN